MLTSISSPHSLPLFPSSHGPSPTSALVTGDVTVLLVRQSKRVARREETLGTSNVSIMRSLRKIASLAIYSFLLVSIASASHVETFSDTECQRPLTEWNGPNGYPDGLCTSVSKNGNWTSFRIVNLNRGCASMSCRMKVPLPPTDRKNSHDLWTGHARRTMRLFRRSRRHRC